MSDPARLHGSGVRAIPANWISSLSLKYQSRCRQYGIAQARLNQPTSTLHFMMCLRDDDVGEDVSARFSCRSFERARCQLPIQKAYTTLMRNSYISIYSNKLCTKIIIFDKGAFCDRARVCSFRGWTTGVDCGIATSASYTCIMDVGACMLYLCTGWLNDMSDFVLNRCGVLWCSHTRTLCVATMAARLHKSIFTTVNAHT